MRARLLTIAAAALSLVGLALVAPTQPAATAEQAPAVAPGFVAKSIDWERCRDPYLREFGARCGRLEVPLDHADPDGPTIKVGVSRIKHTSKKRYRGVMLTNPGGPGGAGRWMAALTHYVPGKVASTYDWIGVDPRGVGSSRPRLSCNGKYFRFGRPPYIPETDAIMDRWLRKTERYAADCAESNASELLPHLKTTDTIADYEVLREALGVERVGFYGSSYGSYLGQVYATLHPDRIKRLVMDGVVDPELVWYDANLAQDPAFQKAFHKFFRWVGKNKRFYHLGGSKKKVTKRYYALVEKLTKDRVHGIGPAELVDGILGAGYNVYTWPDVADALAALANKGRARPMRSLYRANAPFGDGADNGYAMYLATECTDAAWPNSWNTWTRDNWEVHQVAPIMTWANAWFNAPCRSWPAQADRPVEVSGENVDIPILLVSETYDAATPFAGALNVRRLFPTASLIEGVGGTTHSPSLYGVECVDHAIRDYLARGVTPKRVAGDSADLQCPRIKPPKGLNRPLPKRPMILR